MSEKTKKQLVKMRDSVLNAIHADEVTMRSRYYFLVRSALWVLGSILAFGITLYLISFIAFLFRGNALYALTSLGPKGFTTLFFSLPWVLLLLVFLVFVLLQFLSTHFAFVYRRPFIHTILASVFVLIIGGVLIGQSTLHDRAYRFSQEHRVPFAGSLYKDAVRERDNIRIGTMHNYTDTGFALKGRDGIDYSVTITETTRMPHIALEENTMVLVIGETNDTFIQAFGVRPIKKGHILTPRNNEKENGFRVPKKSSSPR